MKNKNLVISIVVILVVILGLYLLMRGGGSDVTTNPDGTTNTTGGNGSGNGAGTGSGTPTPSPTVVTPAPAAPALGIHYVSIQQFAYSPASITIKKGDTITWDNKDSAQHTVTGDNGKGPVSSNLVNNDTYSYTFTTPGTYTYHCNFHPSMKGTVIVTN